ncbi:hypothetical protein HNO88_004420 [Novosphingobium chloroacetimidivorans]|uniref:Uncharacterized protein n=1 Tax=Novosphingobium chloroacetimidivorans TaxID=1428314 RepID=A0A7W7KDZ1_9SPHN|nr:hypothetical protein [Novosphingobium chloroacetimidivorans]MBB4861072.1 hypothetical protein [Novosphingobium chloroacetimidivorans]
MIHEALSAWIALYMGVGVLAGMCATGAIVQTAIEIRAGKWRPLLSSRRLDYALWAPRIWLSWQRNYLRGMPVVLASAALYANHIGFGVLGDV